MEAKHATDETMYSWRSPTRDDDTDNDADDHRPVVQDDPLRVTYSIPQSNVPSLGEILVKDAPRAVLYMLAAQIRRFHSPSPHHEATKSNSSAASASAASASAASASTASASAGPARVVESGASVPYFAAVRKLDEQFSSDATLVIRTGSVSECHPITALLLAIQRSRQEVLALKQSCAAVFDQARRSGAIAHEYSK